ncbi:hypothetical protein ACEWY4_024386 [Coilia grayii]|uniref:Phostensin n=1 Tax=Coilia grayii TaxID=363190 RepID=A0ABD1J092_9TELE
MSVSSLPEWKQLLLERKRREEEERERREREEEERLLSMPAWKRGIIQRRRAKQEGGGERDPEKEREGGYQVVDSGDSESYILSPTSSDVNIILEPESPRYDPQTVRAFGRVSVENIGPVRQNPFIRSQNSWRKNKGLEKAVNDQEKATDGERGQNRSHERDLIREREIEVKAERFRDRIEDRERDRSIGRESAKFRGGEGDKDNMRTAKEGLRDTDNTLFPLAPGVRTIKAENIIIIEKERRGSEREENDRETIVERERETLEMEEDGKEGGGEKRGMKMGLRDILAGGGCVTEIRATEVLIIKPGAEDRSKGARFGIDGEEDQGTREGEGQGQEVQGRNRSSSSEDTVTDKRDRLREPRWAQDHMQCWREMADMKEPAVWLKPQENELSSRSNTDNSGLLERGGRVSQLLSKFGERPKPPSRSKSSECFVRPSRVKERPSVEGSSDDLSPGEEVQEEDADRGLLKRSRSFSHRVIFARENGSLDVGYHDSKTVERVFSSNCRTEEHPERGTKPRVLLRWKHGDKKINPVAKSDLKVERSVDRQSGIDGDSVKKAVNDMVTTHKAEVHREGPVGSAVKMTQDEGFTMASVKNTEGIAFARKVSIRQEGKEKATGSETKGNENVTNRASEKSEEQITEIDIREREMEREKMIQREKEWERQIELQIEEKKQRNSWRMEAESKPLQCMCVQSSEIVNSVYVPNSPSRVLPAAIDLLTVPRSPTVKEAGIIGRPDWDCAESQEHILSQMVLSQHTEELISKIGRVKDKRPDRENRRMTQTCVYVGTNMTGIQESQHTDSPKDEVVKNSITQPLPNSYSGIMYKDESMVLKSPKQCVSVGQPTDLDEIQIPRTVFFGVDMALERPRPRIPSSADGPEDGGTGGEPESWGAGRPLTRIESLREKIRQHELERQRISRATEAKDVESRGNRERDWSTDAEMGKDRWRDLAHERAVEERRKMGWEMEGGENETAEWRQEEPSLLSASQFDVTQEPSVSRANPQLPVPLSLSQLLVAEEQDRSVYIETSVEVFSDHTEDIEVEELTQHVEDLTSDQVWRHQDSDRPKGVDEGEGEDREELRDEDYLPPSQTSSPTSSLSPSPPLPHSLGAMSRIYNLKTVGSRAGLCISERPVEVVSHKPLPQEDYRPFHKKNTQEPTHPQEGQGDCDKPEHPWELSNESLSVLSVQRQVEQLRLREQEVRRQTVGERQAEKSDKKTQQHQFQHIDGPTRDRSSPTGPRTPPTPREQPKPTQSKAFCGPSPENARKHLERPTAPVPPSPPLTLSPSPTRTPSPSPSPSPSPPIISIRSASSGPGKRGTTITITPRKPAGAPAAAAAAAAASPSGSPRSKQAGQTQTPAPNGTGDGGKKRYPTAEEIQVIGGYQNLEKSCLVKSRGTAHKGVKVCFDEAQLEQVCEYPSENSLLASFPPSPMLGSNAGREEERGRGQKEEEEDEDEEESGIYRNLASGRGRVLRVGQCPPHLNKQIR